MATIVTLGSLSFRNATAAKALLRSKFDSYTIGQRVPDEDVSLWFAAIENHEDFLSWSRVDGIVHFSCEIHRFHKNKCMAVVYEDGSREPFSYLKCVGSKPLSKLDKALRAFRNEIKPQIAEFRAGRRGGHIHHLGKPFVQITDEWLMLNRHLWHSIEVDITEAHGYQLRDRDLAADWQAFHKTNARLKLIPAKENLSAGAGGYLARFVPPLEPPPY